MDTIITEPATKRMRNGSVILTNRMCEKRVAKRTAKSCGPDAPTLASSWRDDPSTTVARKPGHRGEREGNR